MIDSQRIYVELWRKEDERWFLAHEISEITDSVEIKSINAIFTLNDFYENALELM